MSLFELFPPSPPISGNIEDEDILSSSGMMMMTDLDSALSSSLSSLSSIADSLVEFIPFTAPPQDDDNIPMLTSSSSSDDDDDYHESVVTNKDNNDQQEEEIKKSFDDWITSSANPSPLRTLSKDEVSTTVSVEDARLLNRIKDASTLNSVIDSFVVKLKLVMSPLNQLRTFYKNPANSTAPCGCNMVCFLFRSIKYGSNNNLLRWFHSHQREHRHSMNDMLGSDNAACKESLMHSGGKFVDLIGNNATSLSEFLRVHLPLLTDDVPRHKQKVALIFSPTTLGRRRLREFKGNPVVVSSFALPRCVFHFILSLHFGPSAAKSLLASSPSTKTDRFLRQGTLTPHPKMLNIDPEVLLLQTQYDNVRKRTVELCSLFPVGAQRVFNALEIRYGR